ERLRVLEIDYELDAGGLWYRQVARLLSLENTSNVDPGLTIGFGDARAITHQGAVRDRLWHAERRQVMPQAHRGNLFATDGKVGILGKKSGNPLLDGTGEGGLDLVFGGGVDNNNLQAEAGGGHLRARQCVFRPHPGTRVQQNGDSRDAWKRLAHPLKLPFPPPPPPTLHPPPPPPP